MMMNYWIHINKNDFVLKKEVCESTPPSIGSDIVKVERIEFDSVGIGWRRNCINSVNHEWIPPIGNVGDIEEDLLNIVRERMTEIHRSLDKSNHIVIEYLESQLNEDALPADVKETITERTALRTELAELLSFMKSEQK